MTSFRPGVRILTAIVALVVVACLLPTLPGEAATRGRMRKAAVLFKPTVTNVVTRADQIAQQQGWTVESTLGTLKGFIAIIPENVGDETVTVVDNTADVETAVLDTEVDATAVPWGLDRIDQRGLPLTGTYSSSLTGAGVTAYVVDTGVNPSSEFGGRLLPGFNFVDGLTGTADCVGGTGHGTHVAGTIASTSYGVARQAKVVPMRVLGCAGTGYWSDVIQALERIAVDHDPGEPAVANLSLSGPRYEPADTAINRVLADGVTVVASAGNDGDDACADSPAGVPDALTIGATAKDDSRAPYSNVGSCVDLFAPGDGIDSVPISGTAPAKKSGTSMAAAHVSGVAALFLQGNTTANPIAVRAAIINNATTDVVTDAQSEHDGLLYSKFGKAPKAPENVTAAASDGVVTVGWTEPTTPSDPPISRYRIIPSTSGPAPNPSAVGVGPDARSFVFPDLANGQEYSFQVRAINPVGQSAASASATATPHETDRPDLVVTDIATSPSPLNDGDSVAFEATILNVGNQPTSGGVNHVVQFKVDGVNRAVSSSFKGPLQPGVPQTVIANTNSRWIATAGDHAVSAFVDSIGAFDEENDESSGVDNNTFSESLFVGTNDKTNVRLAAAGASGTLVVWQDSRNGNQDIYATRVGSDGHPVGGEIQLTDDLRDQTQPTVAGNGTSWLVAWTDGRGAGESDVYGTIVTSTGGRTLNGSVISAATGDQTNPNARTSEGKWLVVWQDTRNAATNATDIYGRRITLTGTFSGSEFPVSRAPLDQRRPSVVGNGTAGWIVVWSDRRRQDKDGAFGSNIYGTQVPPTGSVTTPAGFAISRAPFDQSSPAIFQSSAGLAVVWADYRSGKTLDIYGTRLTSTGGVTDPAGIAISKSTTVSESSPAISAIGENFFVAWHQQVDGTSPPSRNILGARFTKTGTVTQTPGVISQRAGDQQLPAVGVLGNTTYLVAYSDQVGSSYDIIGIRYTSAGALVGDPFTISS